MLSFASDFWLVFWTVIGAGALLTVLLTLLVAVFSPAWFRSRPWHRPAATPVRLPERPAGREHPAGREPKAA